MGLIAILVILANLFEVNFNSKSKQEEDKMDIMLVEININPTS
jgi:hypothetical protein